MRVIAGAARGRPLRTVKSEGLRPTSDLVRGAIFDMVGPFFLERTRIADFYAGTGALGIEALSRGADWADLVERNPRHCAVIRENLELTGFSEAARVFCRPLPQALQHLSGPYQLVFLDPPYAQPLEGMFFDLMIEHGLVEVGSLVVVEHSLRQPVQSSYSALRLNKERQHGDTVISVYVMEGEDIG